MRQDVIFKDLGTIEYGEAWEYQESLLKANTSIKSQRVKWETTEETKHHLLFCEHPPVYTLGKSGDEAHVLISKEELAKRNIAYYPTNRGGEIPEVTRRSYY
jgi:lipoyl(octanoyl) transferase